MKLKIKVSYLAVLISFFIGFLAGMAVYKYVDEYQMRKYLEEDHSELQKEDTVQGEFYIPRKALEDSAEDIRVTVRLQP